MKEFINDDADKFPELEVRMVNGQKPQLVMLGEDEQVEDTLSIGSWNRDTIIDYLQENLAGSVTEGSEES